MIRRIRRLAAVCAVLALASCASAPTRFYTLLPQASPAPARAAGAGYAVSVLPVTIPAQDDRPQLVMRQSDDRVVLLEGEQWIAPLADQVRDALSAELSRKLAALDVYGLPRAGHEPVYRIMTDVRRFESVSGRYARIDAVWSVRASDDDAHALRCSSSLTEPVGDGVGAMVRGHQQALAALSDRIAGVVRAMAAGEGARCP